MGQILTTAIIPSESSTLSVSEKTISMQFGNGYQQDAPQGINYQYEEWSLSYENISLAERNTIRATVMAAGCWDTIQWTAPSGTAKLYKRPKDSKYEETQTANRFTIKFQLKQVAGVLATPAPGSTIWDGGATTWDGGATTWDAGSSSVVWDGGSSVWDGGASIWT